MIKSACKLVLRSKMSVSEVARETGFVTASTFNRQFTAVKGISPLKWRQIAAEKTEIVQVESLEAGQLADIFMN